MRGREKAGEKTGEKAEKKTREKEGGEGDKVHC
jgi:hypothetical protein